MVYLIAFIGAARQFRALIGERGMLPVPDFVARVPFRTQPSIFHIHYSDRFFAAVCWFGAALSAAIVAGATDLVPLWAAMVMWLVLWVLYLSIVNVGQRWYGFGWESLLLEAGFVAIFLGNDETAPPVLAILLARWLLFRVEFGAGLIKLRGDPCWRDLTCLYYHHETQPMPGPLSWFFHHLPKPLHRVEVAGNHFAQLVVPFALFAPQPVASAGRGDSDRHPAVAGALRQLRLAELADDHPRVQRDRPVLVRIGAAGARPAGSAEPARSGSPALVIVFAALTVSLSYWPVRNMISSHQRMNAAFNPYHLINTYGAFGSIGRVRLEVVIEGTDETEITEQTVWKEYGFKGKPGDPHRMPRQWAPYHLRLDWLMWFAALTPALCAGLARPVRDYGCCRTIRRRCACFGTIRSPTRRRGMCGLSSMSTGSPRGANCGASGCGGVAPSLVSTCHPSPSGRPNRARLAPPASRATAKCQRFSGVSTHRHGRSR